MLSATDNNLYSSDMLGQTTYNYRLKNNPQFDIIKLLGNDFRPLSQKTI